MLKGLKHELKHFFSETNKRYQGKKGKVIIRFIDYLFCRVVYGANAKDYYAYQFPKKSARQRNGFMTERRLASLVRIANGNADTDILLDKTRANTLFSEFSGRDWIDMDTADFTEFSIFCKKHDELFCKPKTLRAGRGIRIERVCDYKNLHELYNTLHAEHYMCEERIRQGGILCALNPQTVNTIRMATINCDDEIHIVAAALRMGVGDSVTDHMARGGIHAIIDVDSGTVTTAASNYSEARYEKHPISGNQILGITIPYWKETCAIIKRAAQRIPDIRYVGWDIAICEGESVCIIEANSFSGGTSLQLPDQIGKWKAFSAFIPRLKKNKLAKKKAIKQDKNTESINNKNA